MIFLCKKNINSRIKKAKAKIILLKFGIELPVTILEKYVCPGIK